MNRFCILYEGRFSPVFLAQAELNPCCFICELLHKLSKIQLVLSKLLREMNKTLRTNSVSTSTAQLSVIIEATELTFQASIDALQSATGLRPVDHTVLPPETG